MKHNNWVTSVAFSPHGKYLVSASMDTTIRVRGVTPGEEVIRMTPGSSDLSVAFSPDGKYVISGCDDGAARIWELATGKEIAIMNHDDYVRSVAFSRDGKFVISGSDDKTIRIWQWLVKDLELNACAYLPRNLTRVEWQQYIGDALPYQAICPNLPIEPEMTITPTP